MTFLAIYFEERRGGCHNLSINHLVFIVPNGCFIVGIVDIEISNAPIASGKFGKCRILPFFFTPSLVQAILKLDTLPFLIRKKEVLSLVAENRC